MSFGRMASLVIAIAAIVGVFVYIPYLSNYAFWVLVGAYLLWQAVHPLNRKNRFRWRTMLEIVLLLAAIVGVFVEIPIISDYAFWILAAAYLITIGSTSLK
jgi:hypothetical protein